MPEKPVKVLFEIEVQKKEELKKLKEDVEKFGGKIKEVTKITEEGFKKAGFSITFIAWHFRYLGSIFAKIHSQWMKFVQDTIKTSAELQESFLSIEVAAAIYGSSAERATKLTKELALTGLLPLTDAANIVKNLMITGIGLPELEKFTYRYLDVAFLFTSGADEMTKSLNTMSQSILRGTLVLSTDVAARNLWTETEKRLQRTMGVSMKELSAKRRAIELLTTIETKYAATQDLHQMEIETTRAAMNRLNTSIILIKEAFGTALLPILEVVSIQLAKLSIYITELIKSFGPAIAAITATGLAMTYLISKIGFGLGIIASFVMIAHRAGYALWKFYVPMIAVSAAITAGAYLFLKYTGALDRAKASAQKIGDHIAKLREEIGGLMSTQEESIDIDEDKRIQHERTVADIMEDLERERSKGLWANQMSIKDLEKRLSRENEDWDRYLKGRGALEEEGQKGSTSLLDQLLDKTKTTSEELGKIDWWKAIREQTEKFQEWIADIETWKKIGEIIGKWIGEGIKAVTNLLGWLTEKLQKKDWFTLGENLGRWIREGLVAFFTGIYISLFGTEEQQKKLGEKLGENMRKGFGIQLAIFGIELMKAFADFGLGIVTGLFKKPFEDFLSWFRNQLNILIVWINRLPVIEIPIIPEFEWEKGKKGFPAYGLPIAQFGGIVPGMRNQPVPVLAHGGERIIPAGEVGGGGGNITINFNNAIVRESADLDKIAQKVGAILGQRTRWARLGAL